MIISYVHVIELVGNLRFSRRWRFEVFWVVTSCSVVVGYQHFEGPSLKTKVARSSK